MTRRSVPSSREDLIERIRAVAAEMGVPRLSRRTFLSRADLSSWAIDKHFDSWSDACRAAGIDDAPSVAEVPKEQRYTDEQCLAELRRVAALKKTTALSSKQYSGYGRISHSTICRRFGGWDQALRAAGLTRTVSAERLKPLTREECVQHLQRVARALGRQYLTSKEYGEHGEVSAVRIVRVFGSWHAALKAAGLDPSPNFKREVLLSTLASDFLRASIDLRHIPTLVQLTRRSRHVSHTFSGKYGGYREFKRQAIDHLFSTNPFMPLAIRNLFEVERLRLVGSAAPASGTPTAPPHRQGRTLNFRAFAYTPTSEHDVVQLFGAVADELGFEIVGNRSAFPDCEARRARPGARASFVPCLIEYEFASSDYRRHKHPATGCDLIVCWVHDWPDCPVEVLELSAAIKDLGGWR